MPRHLPRMPLASILWLSAADTDMWAWIPQGCAQAEFTTKRTALAQLAPPTQGVRELPGGRTTTFRAGLILCVPCRVMRRMVIANNAVAGKSGDFLCITRYR